jgi:hypothetical protein
MTEPTIIEENEFFAGASLAADDELLRLDLLQSTKENNNPNDE